MAMTIEDRALKKYMNKPEVDEFLDLFMHEGKFDHTIIDEYITIFVEEGGFKFKWGDIIPAAKMLDKEGVVNVITAADIKELKTLILSRLNVSATQQSL